jgi:pyridinium-3,5-bisthiocarboxylic acid mononucleotide nickel chelatase
MTAPEDHDAAPTVLWIDAGNGAAGDMLLAASLDAGADVSVIRAGLSRLPVGPVELDVQQVRRFGLRAVQVTVRAPDQAVHRTLADITAIISRAGLSRAVAAFACATFERLASAEASVHGVSVEAVHFHEVGALDAVADVVGCALALGDLGVLAAPERIVSPTALGTGTVSSAHGRLPVPAPAVLELMARAGAPIRAHPAEMELCTPTGAALLTTLATGWGPVPTCTPHRVGVGAGTADPSGHPNVLRVLTGARDRTRTTWQSAPLYQLEATIDDLDPRIWPDLLELLRAAGAYDAWCTPALMRKGRPGQVLSVLTDADRTDLMCRIVFEQTTTFGVRVFPVERRALPRDRVAVPVGTGAAVHVKRAYLGERVVTVQPEYDEVLAEARRSDTPVAAVLAEVHRRLDEANSAAVTRAADGTACWSRSAVPGAEPRDPAETEASP